MWRASIWYLICWLRARFYDFLAHMRFTRFHRTWTCPSSPYLGSSGPSLCPSRAGSWYSCRPWKTTPWETIKTSFASTWWLNLTRLIKVKKSLLVRLFYFLEGGGKRGVFWWVLKNYYCVNLVVSRRTQPFPDLWDIVLAQGTLNKKRCLLLFAT